MEVSPQTQNQLFGNLPPDRLQLLTDGQEPNARRIVKLLNYSKKDVASVAKVAPASVRYDRKMPAEVRARLIEWAFALNRVASFFEDDDKTVLWFKAPNPMLGGITPRDMIRAGRFVKLMRFIDAALDTKVIPPR